MFDPVVGGRGTYHAAIVHQRGDSVKANSAIRTYLRLYDAPHERTDHEHCHRSQPASVRASVRVLKSSSSAAERAASIAILTTLRRVRTPAERTRSACTNGGRVATARPARAHCTTLGQSQRTGPQAFVRAESRPLTSKSAGVRAVLRQRVTATVYAPISRRVWSCAACLVPRVAHAPVLQVVPTVPCVHLPDTQRSRVETRATSLSEPASVPRDLELKPTEAHTVPRARIAQANASSRSPRRSLWNYAPGYL